MGAPSVQQNEGGTLAMLAPLAPSLVVLEPISFASLASLAPVALVVSVVAVRNPTMTGITPGLDASARYTSPDWSIRMFSKSSSKQDKQLTPGEIKRLKDSGFDPHDLKGNKRTGQTDLYKTPSGDIVVKGKGGKGPGEPTGININDL